MRVYEDIDFKNRSFILTMRNVNRGGKERDNKDILVLY